MCKKDIPYNILFTQNIMEILQILINTLLSRNPAVQTRPKQENTAMNTFNVKNQA